MRFVHGLSIFLNACLLVGLLVAFFGRVIPDGPMWADLFHYALMALMFVAPTIAILASLVSIRPPHTHH